MMRAIVVVIMLGLFAALPASPGAVASEQDRARGAVEAGEVRPLGDILAGVRGKYPGRVLDADLREQGRGNWQYDIKILQSDGRVLRVAVDAKTGRVLSVEGEGSGRNGGGSKRNGSR